MSAQIHSPGLVNVTFDDGPDPDWTPAILDLLAAAGARATFFVIGRRAASSPALLRRAVAEGHEIGNHGWSHRHPFAVNARRARLEVIDGARAIEDALGRPAHFFRPAHGRVRAQMLDAAAERGQHLVLWDVSALDWGPLGTARAIGRRLDRVRANDIVLMHDSSRGINRPAELALALPGFLDGLRRLHLVSMPLLAGLGGRREDRSEHGAGSTK